MAMAPPRMLPAVPTLMRLSKSMMQGATSILNKVPSGAVITGPPGSIQMLSLVVDHGKFFTSP